MSGSHEFKLKKMKTYEKIIIGCFLSGICLAMSCRTAPEDGGLSYPLPWGGSSWNTYHVNISDTLILHQAKALVETDLKEAGYRYVDIDDGYFGGRAENGQLLIHPQRFPHGLEPVVDGIHSLVLKARIYSDAGRNT